MKVSNEINTLPTQALKCQREFYVFFLHLLLLLLLLIAFNEACGMWHVACSVRLVDRRKVRKIYQINPVWNLIQIQIQLQQQMQIQLQQQIQIKL